jgi:DHA1 family tetracycline resistance protein-like MFS transporter
VTTAHGGSQSASVEASLTPDAAQTPQRVVYFLLLTVALDAMGLGLLIPVTPQLILKLTGEGLARAAIYGGWLTATFAIIQFFAGPLLGSISDHTGRRPVLLISLGAFGLSYVLMGYAPSLAWLFLAQMLTGLFGATPATAGAFLADITPPAGRTRVFGSMAAAFGTGFIIGPALGGMLVSYGLRVPFLTAAALSGVTVIYGALVLPESLPRSRRRGFAWRRANPWGAVSELRRRSHVVLLLLTAFLQRVSTSALPATWPYFSMQQYGWGSRQVGYSLAAFGVATVVNQVWLLRWMDRTIGPVRAAEFGLLMLALGYVGFAFGHGAWVAPVCIPLATMGFMAGPALASMLSVRVAGDAQGMLQGVLASINGVAAVLTPLIMPTLFSVFSSGNLGIRFPGAPYILSAALAVLGTLFVARGAAAHGPNRAL